MTKTTRSGRLLTEAIEVISAVEGGKAVSIIQDEIGIYIGNKSGRTIESWRYRGVPAHLDVGDLEKLAKCLAKRTILTQRTIIRLDQKWFNRFLFHAGHPSPGAFCQQIFSELPNLPVQSQGLGKHNERLVRQSI